MEGKDIVSINGFDYIELYVGNAHQAAHYYRTAFGFLIVAYAGLETGERDRVSFILEQGKVRLVLTGPTGPEGQIAEQVWLQGDSVKDIAFVVDDARKTFAVAVERGATPVMEPVVYEEPEGRMIRAAVEACGHVVHTFTQLEGDHSGFPPQYRSLLRTPAAATTGIESIDHIALGVNNGDLDKWVDFYKHTFGFHQSHQEDIFTEYSGMNSKVVQNRTRSVKFPIVEPAPGRRKSQIEEYLEFNHGPGPQHIAFLSDNIIKTVDILRKNSVDFLSSPATYYQFLESRLGNIEEDLDALRERDILADRDNWGYLLQIFSKPLQSRPTLFIEIIQRVGARGFGGGNIRALFEAVEREQAMRGNL